MCVYVFFFSRKMFFVGLFGGLVECLVFFFVGLWSVWLFFLFGGEVCPLTLRWFWGVFLRFDRVLFFWVWWGAWCVFGGLGGVFGVSWVSLL